MSVGEQQRVGFARVFLDEPKMVTATNPEIPSAYSLLKQPHLFEGTPICDLHWLHPMGTLAANTALVLASLLSCEGCKSLLCPYSRCAPGIPGRSHISPGCY